MISKLTEKVMLSKVICMRGKIQADVIFKSKFQKCKIIETFYALGRKGVILV
jgi:hypothetical protein